MTQTTDRDAINPQALAEAITAYLTSTDPQDERDVALEAAFIDQGVMTHDEAINHISPVTSGPEIVGLFIQFDDASMIAVRRDGQVHAA